MVMATWIAMFCLSLTVIPIILVLKNNPNSLVVFKRLVALYACVVIAIFTIASCSAIINQFSPASGFIVMCESARFVMKMHAYLREKCVLGLTRHWVELQESPGPRATSGAQIPPPTISAAATAKSINAETLQERLTAFADFIPSSAAKAGVSIDQVCECTRFAIAFVFVYVET
jgi:hypothetical protein